MFAKLKRALLMHWVVLSALAAIAGVILLRKNTRAYCMESYSHKGVTPAASLHEANLR